MFHRFFHILEICYCFLNKVMDEEDQRFACLTNELRIVFLFVYFWKLKYATEKEHWQKLYFASVSFPPSLCSCGLSFDILGWKMLLADVYWQE